MADGIAHLIERIAGIRSFEVLFALTSLPIFSVATAAVVFIAVWAVVLRSREPAVARGDVAARHVPELRLLGWSGLVLLVVYTGESLLRGYVWDMTNRVSWWAYALPVFVAAVAVTVALLVILLRGASPSATPVGALTRRSWTDFVSSRALVGAASAWIVLVATTVAAGLMSSSDDNGRFVYVELPVPNTDVAPFRPWFYGWTYGVPVLVCAALLLVAVWQALRVNAARPFLRPDTVGAERAFRRAVAEEILRVSAGSALLALGGAWRMVADGGTWTGASIGGDGVAAGDVEIVWKYHDLAVAAGALAPVAEIVGALLLMIAVRAVFTQAAAPRRASLVAA